VLIYPIQYDTYSDVQRQAGSPKIPSPLPQPENNPLPIPLPLPGSTGGVFGGSGTTAEEYEAAKEYLQELATQTGGRLYRASTATDLAVAFKSIADELRETYSLGFYPGEEKRNKKRIKLKVRVSRENAVVRARDSYVLSKKEKSK
jgi:ABC-type glycerol-3-phosphate transport system substrate-binding protein